MGLAHIVVLITTLSRESNFTSCTELAKVQMTIVWVVANTLISQIMLRILQELTRGIQSLPRAEASPELQQQQVSRQGGSNDGKILASGSSR
jgi:hypothetical protein